MLPLLALSVLTTLFQDFAARLRSTEFLNDARHSDRRVPAPALRRAAGHCLKNTPLPSCVTPSSGKTALKSTGC
ncbi:hypothetical protein F0185_04635 [Massilia sp. CCM 8692]|uniref:Secreted protein n=1 Tax=Massilia rubra TaxID=2607910 RepID=A0ABX0LF68_9BURK|nr:hypothetical protein [Massilia rubra]